MSADERVQAVVTGQPEMRLLACTQCGVIVWDIDAHYAHAHAETVGAVTEESGRPKARASDFAAGTRWMCEDGSVWEVAWDAPAQRWTWVPLEQEGQVER